MLKEGGGETREKKRHPAKARKEAPPKAKVKKKSDDRQLKLFDDS